MSFRTTHPVPAAKQIEATNSLVELARLEAEELESGNGHRPSLVEKFSVRARALAAQGVSDEMLDEALDILSGVEGSVVIKALDGSSTNPAEEAEAPAEPVIGAPEPIAAEDVTKPIAVEVKPSVHQREGRITGRRVRVRQPDGSFTTTGLGNLRQRGS